MGKGNAWCLFSASQGPEEERPVAILIHQAWSVSPDLWLANTESWHPEVLDLEKSLTLNSQEPFPAELFAEGILLHRTYVTGQGILWNHDLFFVYIFWVKFCAKCCKCHLCFKWVAVCLEVGAALVSRLLWWDPIGTSSWPWVGAGVLKPIIMPLYGISRWMIKVEGAKII